MKTASEDEEIWRSVVGYEGRYEVSSWGRVRSLPQTYKGSKRARVLSPTLVARYPRVTLSRGGRKKMISVHILVARAFIGPPPTAEHQVAHRDGDALNPRLDNLRYLTVGDNNRERRAHGTMPCGEMVFRAVLNSDLVRYIRRETAQGATLTAIANGLGVGRSTVASVARGRTWRHVT